ncbi:MAG: hypothetical protein LBS11_11635 [Oscillospiraceae bacterium]|jgi:hypothetical protein|nr:hypothetical protein [Oscillospiraceae bacterium]
MSGMKVESAGILLSRKEMALLAGLTGIGGGSLDEADANAAAAGLEQGGLIRRTDEGFQVEERLYGLLKRIAASPKAWALMAGGRVWALYEGGGIPILIRGSEGGGVSITPLEDKETASACLLDALEESDEASFRWGLTGEASVEGGKDAVAGLIRADLLERQWPWNG